MIIKYLKSKIPKHLKHSDDLTNEYESRNTNLIAHQASTGFDISWIDEFVKRIKPYIYVRELDRCLILIPNQVYKLNESAVAVLDFLLKGHSINKFLWFIGNTEEKRKEIHYFFCDLRAIVSGCLQDNEQRQAISYYEFNGAFNEFPVLSEIAVTYRCNLKCDFCYVGDRNYGELNTPSIKKLLFKIYHEAKVPSVSFTGGEPLLRKDICQLIECASKVGLWTNLITNGTLINRNLVKELKKAGLSSAQVSIEGPNPGIHDKITGVLGSFDATIEGIRLLSDAGIPVHTNTTVSRNNLHHLEDIMLLAKRIGLDRLSMNLIIPCGAASDKKYLWVSYSEISDYVLKLKHRSAQENIKFLWYSPVPMCKFNPIAHGFGNKSCAAVTGLLSIDPMGNIIPCSSWRMPVGHLLKENFRDIWRSAVMGYFRNVDYAPDGCHQCVQFDACKGACPLYWQACGLKELDGRT